MWSVVGSESAGLGLLAGEGALRSDLGTGLRLGNLPHLLHFWLIQEPLP